MNKKTLSAIFKKILNSPISLIIGIIFILTVIAGAALAKNNEYSQGTYLITNPVLVEGVTEIQCSIRRYGESEFKLAGNCLNYKDGIYLNKGDEIRYLLQFENGYNMMVSDVSITVKENPDSSKLKLMQYTSKDTTTSLRPNTKIDSSKMYVTEPLFVDQNSTLEIVGVKANKYTVTIKGDQNNKIKDQIKETLCSSCQDSASHSTESPMNYDEFHNCYTADIQYNPNEEYPPAIHLTRTEAYSQTELKTSDFSLVDYTGENDIKNSFLTKKDNTITLSEKNFYQDHTIILNNPASTKNTYTVTNNTGETLSLYTSKEKINPNGNSFSVSYGEDCFIKIGSADNKLKATTKNGEYILPTVTYNNEIHYHLKNVTENMAISKSSTDTDNKIKIFAPSQYEGVNLYYKSGDDKTELTDSIIDTSKSDSVTIVATPTNGYENNFKNIQIYAVPTNILYTKNDYDNAYELNKTINDSTDELSATFEFNPSSYGNEKTYQLLVKGDLKLNEYDLIIGKKFENIENISVSSGGKELTSSTLNSENESSNFYKILYGQDVDIAVTPKENYTCAKAELNAAKISKNEQDTLETFENVTYSDNNNVRTFSLKNIRSNVNTALTNVVHDNITLSFSKSPAEGSFKFNCSNEEITKKINNSNKAEIEYGSKLVFTLTPLEGVEFKNHIQLTGIVKENNGERKITIPRSSDGSYTLKNIVKDVIIDPPAINTKVMEGKLKFLGMDIDTSFAIKSDSIKLTKDSSGKFYNFNFEYGTKKLKFELKIQRKSDDTHTDIKKFLQQYAGNGEYKPTDKLYYCIKEQSDNTQIAGDGEFSEGKGKNGTANYTATQINHNWNSIIKPDDGTIELSIDTNAIKKPISINIWKKDYDSIYDGDDDPGVTLWTFTPEYEIAVPNNCDFDAYFETTPSDREERLLRPKAKKYTVGYDSLYDHVDVNNYPSCLGYCGWWDSIFGPKKLNIKIDYGTRCNRDNFKGFKVDFITRPSNDGIVTDFYNQNFESVRGTFGQLSITNYLPKNRYIENGEEVTDLLERTVEGSKGPDAGVYNDNGDNRFKNIFADVFSILRTPEEAKKLSFHNNVGKAVNLTKRQDNETKTHTLKNKPNSFYWPIAYLIYENLSPYTGHTGGHESNLMNELRANNKDGREEEPKYSWYNRSDPGSPTFLNREDHVPLYTNLHFNKWGKDGTKLSNIPQSSLLLSQMFENITKDNSSEKANGNISFNVEATALHNPTITVNENNKNVDHHEWYNPILDENLNKLTYLVTGGTNINNVTWDKFDMHGLVENYVMTREEFENVNWDNTLKRFRNVQVFLRRNAALSKVTAMYCVKKVRLTPIFESMYFAKNCTIKFPLAAPSAQFYDVSTINGKNYVGLEMSNIYKQLAKQDSYNTSLSCKFIIKVANEYIDTFDPSKISVSPKNWADLSYQEFTDPSAPEGKYYLYTINNIYKDNLEIFVPEIERTSYKITTTNDRSLFFDNDSGEKFINKNVYSGSNFTFRTEANNGYENKETLTITDVKTNKTYILDDDNDYCELPQGTAINRMSSSASTYNTYTVMNMSEDFNIKSSRERKKCLLTFTYHEGASYKDNYGNILKNDNSEKEDTSDYEKSVAFGTNFYFDIQCNDGFDLTKSVVTANGTPLEYINGRYALKSISENIVIEITELPKVKHKVIFTEHEAVTFKDEKNNILKGEKEVEYGESLMFKVELSDAYSNSDYKVKAEHSLTNVSDTLEEIKDADNAEKVDNFGKYKLLDIRENFRIYLEGLEANQYSVDLIDVPGIKYYDEYGNKELSETGTDAQLGNYHFAKVNYNDKFAFKVIAEEGYDLSGLKIYAKKVTSSTRTQLLPSNDTYTIENIKEDYIITAENVNKKSYNVEIRFTDGVKCLNESGETLPNNITVSHGENLSFRLSLDTAYNKSTPLVSIKGTTNALEANSDGIYTLENVTENKIIEITGISKNTYTAKFTSTEGVIFKNIKNKPINGSTEVEYDSTLNFKITLMDAYDKSIPLVLVNDSKTIAESAGIYTVSGINDDIVITVKNVNKNPEEVTMDEINNVPETVSSELDISNVVKATQTYNNLSDEEKKEITNMSQLEKAQQASGILNHQSGNITVSGLDWYIKIVATPLSSDEEKIAYFNQKLERRTTIALYDIYLLNLLTDEKYEIPYGSSVSITMPAPNTDGYKNVVMAHEKSSGNLEYLDINVTDGSLKFSATSFSLFGLAGKKLENYTENPSKTKIAVSNLVENDDELQSLLGEGLVSQIGDLTGKSSSTSNNIASTETSNTEDDDSLTIWQKIGKWISTHELLSVLLIMLLGFLLIWIILVLARKKEHKENQTQ